MMLRFSILTFVLLAAFLTLGSAVRAQDKQSQVILEVSRKRVGMTSPLKKQIYFRLYDDGRLEYETFPIFDPDAEKANFDFVLNQSQLKRAKVSELISIAEQAAFLNAAESYKPLYTHIDAVMVTTVIYRNADVEKRIVIRNYYPEHEKASGFYPRSLRKLLKRVEELRPKTKEERKDGTGKLF